MIGKYQLQLGAQELTSGMASSDYATDGSLGVTSLNINPFTQRGIIYPTAALTDKSTNLVGNLIASCEASGIATSYDRLFVDDAANYYTADNTNALTKQVTGTATTHYKFGKTDMVPFGNKIYVSLDNDVSQWNGGATIVEDWGTTTAGFTFNSNNFWHPLLVYQSLLWIGDGQNMLSFDGSAAFATTSLLNATESIVAFGIDPATGYMMISFQTSALGNYNDTVQPKSFIGLWDGISPKLIRKIPVDEMVTAFYNVQGIVYVGAGKTIGMWNGNGVTFLRKLASATYAAANLPYKHHFSSYNNFLLVVDGLNILAYGEVVAGARKSWFPVIWNANNANNIGIVCNLGSAAFGIGTATNKFYVTNLESTAATTVANLNFNNIYFPRPIFVRRMRIITTGIPISGATDLTITILNEKGSALPISNANRIRQVTATTYVFDFDYTQAKCQGIEIFTTMSNNSYGIVRVIIYYDIAE